LKNLDSAAETNCMILYLCWTRSTI